MSTFVLSIRTSVERGLVPKATMDLNARLTDLRWTYNIEGGFDSAEIGLSSLYGHPVVGYLASGLDIDFHDDVTIRYGSAVVWNGRVRRRRFGDAGLVIGFACEGYVAALHDDWMRATGTTSLTSGDSLRTGISEYAWKVRLGNADQVQLPAVTHSAGIVDYYRMTPGQVAYSITQEGDASGNPVDIQVWEDRVVHVHSRTYPASPTYRVPFDPNRVSWDEDCGEMADRIQVETEIDSGGTTFLAAEGTTSGFFDTWGFTRALLIPTGEQGTAAATALRNTELARRSQPLVQATINVTSDPATWLVRDGGGPWPYYLVRPDGATVAVAGKPQQHIVGVTIDATGGVGTYELGSLDPSIPRNWLIKERRAIHMMSRSIDPQSGRRTR